jgi:hypothetical protein
MFTRLYTINVIQIPVMRPIVKAIFTIVDGGTVYISDAAYIRQIKTDMNETITINFLFFMTSGI